MDTGVRGGTGRPHRLRSLLRWPFGISRRAAILAAVVTAAAVVALSEGVHARFVAAFALAEPLFGRDPVLGAFLFVLLAALSAVMVFFSGVVLVPVGIHTWGPIGCFLLLWGGWVLGGLVTYVVGRHLGRPVVRRLLSSGAVSRYEAAIPAGGSLLTATLVQLALPSDVSGYFFGLLGTRRASISARWRSRSCRTPWGRSISAPRSSSDSTGCSIAAAAIAVARSPGVGSGAGAATGAGA